jgi:RNA polymerase sigma-70 factor (ECF subfamily)
MERTGASDQMASTASPSITAEAFAATYLTRVLRFALMVSPPGTDAEDVAQDAMITALARLDTFDPSRGTMDAWLWKIVVSRACDAGRVMRRTGVLVERIASVGDRDSPISQSTDSLALERLRDQDLIAALRRLPGRYRTVIALRYGAGLSSPDIAQTLGTTSMAVKKTMRRALDRLRADLEARDDGE